MKSEKIPARGSARGDAVRPRDRLQPAQRSPTVPRLSGAPNPESATVPLGVVVAATPTQAAPLALGLQRRHGNRFVARTLKIARQGGAATAAAPAFSVNRAQYLRRVNQALQNLGGRLVAGNTFAGFVQPILRAMLAQVTWRDSAGTDHGGGVIRHTLPGRPPLALNLRLILDDKATPQRAGQFRHTGATDGILSVLVRNNGTAQALTEVLYHEALHMVSWIINRSGGAARIAGAPSRAIRGLQMSRLTTQIAGIRRQIGALAQSVNARRQAAGGTQITSAGLDRMARWLMEEVQVRAETEVFQQFLQVQQQRRQRGGRGRMYMLTRQYGSINARVVDRYVFDYSRVFEPADRTGLTISDRQTLQQLTRTLEGFYQLQVRRRFSLAAYSSGRPRIRPRFGPRPLQPPNLRQRIQAPTRSPPF